MPTILRIDGFQAHDLNRLRLLVTEHRVAFERAWHEHFGSQA